MDPIKTPRSDPEWKIQEEIIKHMTLKGWFVKSTYGNPFQKGLPDLYCCHQSYGVRWVEVKRPKGYSFTENQITVFTGFASKNCGVWVLTNKSEYDNLFYGANWHTFLWKSRGVTLNKEVIVYPKKGPEAVIQNALIAELKKQDWFVVETYGSYYQAGFPDVFVCHKEFGCRWIECKNPKHYHFTSGQMKVFPRLTAEGVGVYVLVGSDKEEMSKLFQPANWHRYIK